MRIAQVSTLATPVRQVGAGSVESLVWLLSRELTAMGHEVSVFAAGGSETPGELVTTLPGPYGENGSPADWQLCEWINLCCAVAQSGRFDVIHAHAYLWALPLLPLCRSAMVNTLHVWPTEDAVKLWRGAPGAVVTAISQAQWNGFAPAPIAAVIPHAIDASQFTFRERADDYVCYFGRFIPEKGPLHAIAAAKALGVRLRMAGPWTPYFREAIEPHLKEGSVEYAGYLAGAARDEFLGRARALLYPVQQAEPFGLVMAEAMTCGTPVVALRVGAAPEVIEQGVTGYCAASMGEFEEKLAASFSLDRARVREQAMLTFDARRMARQYESVYQCAVQRKG